MRIVHVTDCYLPRLGGIEMQVHDLAARQRAAGHDAVVLTRTPAGEGPEASDVPVTRLRAPGTLVDGPGLHAGLAGADMVHLHASLYSPMVWRAGAQAHTARLPVTVTMHSVPPPGWVLRIAGTSFGWTRWRARWTAVSDVAARPLRGMLPRTEIAMLHNGIDVDWWRGRDHDVEHESDGVVTLVAVMRLAQRKRPLHLVRILRRVRELVPAEVPLRAEIIGSGPTHGKVVAALAKHGMDWVTLRGQCTREEIRETYRRADVYLAPATLESFGIAALEARCAGLPVVAMAVGGVGEFVQDGLEGYLVDSDASMAAATARLATDDVVRRQMTAHNNAVRPDMAWDVVLRSCDEHYRLAQTARAGSAGREVTAAH